MVPVIAKSRKRNSEENNSQCFDGLVSREDLDRAYSKRNQKFVSKTVSKSQDLSSYLNDGWEKIRSKNKTHHKLRKLKDIGPGFEDEVWGIFYRMGFFEMNKDSKFFIHRFESNITKQIDIFARAMYLYCRM
jgi:hypothetical protein